MSNEACEILEIGRRVQIPAGMVEFVNGGHTIWVQSADGATTIRIKCSGRILIDQCQNSPVSHCDILVEGDINFCISNDAV